MKTICIYHSRDLDGWMSAAIVQQYEYEQQQLNGLLDGSDPKDIVFLGWDYGDKIPDLSEYHKIIMTDISFPKKEMWKLYARLDNNFIWIDHHISSIKDSENEDYELTFGKRDTRFAACELTWQHFFSEEKIPEIVRLLGRYDCFGHRGTYEEKEILEFQYGARLYMNNYKDCYKYLIGGVDNFAEQSLSFLQTAGEAIYKYLYTEAKQIYKRAFPIEFKINRSGLSREPITKKAYPVYYNFLCINHERFNPINFGIDYHKAGYDGFACFYYKDDKWHFSLYNDNGKVDCSVIAKHYGGGGHAGASGFIITDLKQII